MPQWLQQGYKKKQHLAYYKQDAVLVCYIGTYSFSANPSAKPAYAALRAL